MEFSSILSYAQQLKSLLTAHDQAATQLKLMEIKIQQIDTKLFTTTTEGSHGLNLTLQTRKSTLLGMRKIYNQFRERKWNQVQELSSQILKSTYSSETHDNILESLPRGRQLDNDTTVQCLTEDFCNFSRDM